MHGNSMLGIGGKPVIACANRSRLQSPCAGGSRPDLLRWNPGCGRDPTFVQCGATSGQWAWDWPVGITCATENGCPPGSYPPSVAQAALRRLLSRLLYFGNQPVLPFLRADHTITPEIADAQGLGPIFAAFGPLFKAIRGRAWVLDAHAARVFVPSGTDLVSGGAQANLFRIGARDEFVAAVVFAPVRGAVLLQLRGVVCGEAKTPLKPSGSNVEIMQPTGTAAAAQESIQWGPHTSDGELLQLRLLFGGNSTENEGDTNVALVRLRCKLDDSESTLSADATAPAPWAAPNATPPVLMPTWTPTYGSLL